MFDLPETEFSVLQGVSRDIDQAKAMALHAWVQGSFDAFQELDADSKRDYLRAIHARLKAASEGIDRVVYHRVCQAGDDGEEQSPPSLKKFASRRMGVEP